MSESVKNAAKKVVPRWYRKMAIWKVVTGILAPIASGELLAYFTHVTLPNWVHYTVGSCAVFLFFIRMFVKDVDGDGIVD